MLDYDLVKGLSLVNNANASANNPTAPGAIGLLGLTGKVVGGQVELFATSYGLNELSPSYLYEITDTLSFTSIGQAGNEQFNTLFAAGPGESIRGVVLCTCGSGAFDLDHADCRLRRHRLPRAIDRRNKGTLNTASPLAQAWSDNSRNHVCRGTRVNARSGSTGAGSRVALPSCRFKNRLNHPG